MKGVVLANAPVSYGVFEMTVGTDRYLPAAERLLDEVASAGYAGIDLGPAGYLGSGDQLAARLDERGMGLAGGYIELSFADPRALAEQRRSLDAALDAFDSVRGRVPGPAPRPTLAATRSDAHRAHPGRAQHDTSIGLDAAGWRRFANGLQRVVDHCRDRGFEPTFHHHAATYVEAPREIERVLEITDVGLCLDTGHLIVGGGDPVTGLRDWAERINHVHIKDVRTALLREIIDTEAGADQIWSRGVFCPLGEGGLDVDRFVAALGQANYQGWLVVEQDVIAPDQARFEQAVADQRANARYLEERGL